MVQPADLPRLYPERFFDRTERDCELGCNVYPFPEQPDHPRVSPPSARAQGAPHVVSPPDMRRAAPVAVPPSRITGAGLASLRNQGERGTGVFSEPLRILAGGFALAFFLFGGMYSLALLIYGAGQ